MILLIFFYALVLICSKITSKIPLICCKLLQFVISIEVKSGPQGIRLYIEPDMQDVAVFDDIIFSLDR